MAGACNVLGIALDRVTHDEALDRLSAFVRTGRPHHVVTVNLDFLRLAQRDPAFRAALDSADLVLADGMPVVWLSRVAGDGLPACVSGIDIVESCAQLAAARGYRTFFLGAAPGVAAGAAAALQRQYPGLQVAGVLAPPVGPFAPALDAELVAAVRAAQPDLLFVALGAPRQDMWIRAHLEELAVPVCIGVGGTFDVLSGRLARAPRWMQRSGLEWLFRLGQEPGRLWRRYLLGDLPLLARAVGGRVLRAGETP